MFRLPKVEEMESGKKWKWKWKWKWKIKSTGYNSRLAQ
jgi:hypothetical protein